MLSYETFILGEFPLLVVQSYFITWVSIGGSEQFRNGTQMGQIVGSLKAGGVPGVHVRLYLSLTEKTLIPPALQV